MNPRSTGYPQAPAHGPAPAGNTRSPQNLLKRTMFTHRDVDRFRPGTSLAFPPIGADPERPFPPPSPSNPQPDFGPCETRCSKKSGRYAGRSRFGPQAFDTGRPPNRPLSPPRVMVRPAGHLGFASGTASKHDRTRRGLIRLLDATQDRRPAVSPKRT